MKKIKFCFIIHNHQPIGNFESIFQSAYRSCYFPFLELLDKHPYFRISLHFSGILLNWIKQNHPPAVDLIVKLVKRNQIEMMSGAYYEPILSIIPDRDKIGQIKKLSGFLQNEFGCVACGMWLAERIWEPHLPKPISQAGIRYTVLDDTHFKYSGLKDEELLGYYITKSRDISYPFFREAKFCVMPFPLKSRNKP